MRRAACALVAAALLAGCGVAPVATESGLRVPVAVREAADRQIVVTIADDGAGVAAPAGGSPRPAVGSGAYAASPWGQRTAVALARDYGLERVAAWYIRVLSVHCVVLQAADPGAREAALARLRSDPRVASAEPMRRYSTGTRPTAYNDPYFDLQTSATVLELADAHRWARGRGVTVAVIDTGVDLRHPDIAGRVSAARNFVDDDAAQFARDRHGTAVVGVLAAAANNGVGIVGVAPEVRIVALKACWERGAAAPAECNTLTLAAALAAAIEGRTRVINLSLTGPADPLLDRLVQRALAGNIVVVAPFDERAPRADTYPASFDGVLAVADADAAIVPAPAPAPPLAAPGRDVLTLTPAGHYGFASGASLSSAMVSGIAALLLERRPDLDAAAVRVLLGRTAQAGTDRRAVLLVNACSAVAAVVAHANCAGGAGSAVAARLPDWRAHRQGAVVPGIRGPTGVVP